MNTIKVIIILSISLLAATISLILALLLIEDSTVALTMAVIIAVLYMALCIIVEYKYKQFSNNEVKGGLHSNIRDIMHPEAKRITNYDVFKVHNELKPDHKPMVMNDMERVCQCDYPYIDNATHHHCKTCKGIIMLLVLAFTIAGCNTTKKISDKRKYNIHWRSNW